MADRTPAELKLVVAAWYPGLKPEAVEFLGNLAVGFYETLQLPHTPEQQLKVIQRKLRSEVLKINSVVNASSTRW